MKRKYLRSLSSFFIFTIFLKLPGIKPHSSPSHLNEKVKISTINSNSMNKTLEYFKNLGEAISVLVPDKKGIPALFYCYFQTNSDNFTYTPLDEFSEKNTEENLIKYNKIPVLTKTIVRNQTLYNINFSKIFPLVNNFYAFFEKSEEKPKNKSSIDTRVLKFRKHIQELFSEKTFQNYLSLLLVIFFIEIKYASMFSDKIDLGKEKIFTKEFQESVFFAKNKCISLAVELIKKNISYLIQNNTAKSWQNSREVTTQNLFSYLIEYTKELIAYDKNNEKEKTSISNISSLMNTYATMYSKETINIKHNIEIINKDIIYNIKELTEITTNNISKDYFEEQLSIQKQKLIMANLKKISQNQPKIPYKFLFSFYPEYLLINQVKNALFSDYSKGNFYAELLEDILYPYDPLSFFSDQEKIKNFFGNYFKENLNDKAIIDYAIQISYLLQKKNENQDLQKINQLFFKLFQLFFLKWDLINCQLETERTKFFQKIRSYVSLIPQKIKWNTLGKIWAFFHGKKAIEPVTQRMRNKHLLDLEQNQTNDIFDDTERYSTKEGYREFKNDMTRLKKKINYVTDSPALFGRYVKRKVRSVFG